MSDPLLFLLLLVALTGALMTFVLWRPERLYEYPFFMGAVFLSFIVPQAYSLVRFPGGATDESVAATLLMSCLSLAMCCAGYLINGRHGVPQNHIIPVNRERLAFGGLLFTGIGWVFTWMILQMSEEETGGSMWTGRVTIYAFFAQLIYPAFSILLRTAIETRSPVWWAGCVCAALPALYATIFGGRREPTVLFLLTIALTLFFYRRVRLQRWMVSVAIVLAAVAIPATGIYRTIAAEREWNLLKQFSPSDNFKDWLSEEQRVLELRNAAVIIDSIADSRDYHFGVGYWDELVWRFVPAQWFGNEFKQNCFADSTKTSNRNYSAARMKPLPVPPSLESVIHSVSLAILVVSSSRSSGCSFASCGTRQLSATASLRRSSTSKSALPPCGL
jgi:hypothetical protein